MLDSGNLLNSVVERMLAGVATRPHADVAESMGEGLERRFKSMSKSDRFEATIAASPTRSAVAMKAHRVINPLPRLARCSLRGKQRAWNSPEISALRREEGPKLGDTNGDAHAMADIRGRMLLSVVGSVYESAPQNGDADRQWQGNDPASQSPAGVPRGTR